MLGKTLVHTCPVSSSTMVIGLFVIFLCISETVDFHIMVKSLHLCAVYIH